MAVFALGLNHTTAPLDLRGRLAFAPGQVGPALLRLRSPVAISSFNGLKAVEIAFQRMTEGWRPVDAAVAGVSVVEDDPEDDGVGIGGLPNEDGVVELDASVMDGPSGLAGAVASLQNIQNPAQVALKVMRHTDHVLLVGEGALRFARAHGFPEVNLLTEAARKKWLEWKEKRSAIDDWISPDENGAHGKEWFDKYKHKTGTIHLDQMSLVEKADRAIRLRHDPRDGGLAGARVAGEHQVRRKIDRPESVRGSHRVDTVRLHESAHEALDLGDAGH
jgi:N4-(beta-N-acetylglucosaminyl)-L-asparaginase